MLIKLLLNLLNFPHLFFFFFKNATFKEVVTGSFVILVQNETRDWGSHATPVRCCGAIWLSELHLPPPHALA